jgi:hypothetical protein
MKTLGMMGVGLLVAAAAGTANAGPMTRFGLTFAASDQAAPNETEVGPTIAIGERIGSLTLEVDYAYLSFMEPHVSTDGMQRLGVNARADVISVTADHCRRYFACTRGSSVFVEGGIAERYGQWHIDYDTVSPTNSERAREAHVGIGIELDNHLHPNRYGWQFDVRLAMSPHDPLMDASCRSTSCNTTMPAGMTTAGSGGYDKAVLFDWTFIVGS